MLQVIPTLLSWAIGAVMIVVLIDQVFGPLKSAESVVITVFMGLMGGILLALPVFALSMKWIHGSRSW